MVGTLAKASGDEHGSGAVMAVDGMMSGRRAKRLVLVVEDSKINRAMLTAMLEDEFDVIEAENGEVGLELLAEYHQDLSLILLDVYMPVCDGFEFLRRKRADALYDAIPVIVATASESSADEIACLELGANDFVVKPYNFEIMVNRMNNLIRLRESASIVNQLTWDNVTGLYNKVFFLRMVEDALAELPDVEFDMLCSEIENFVALGDRYGDANCDTLLRDLATRLSGRLDDLVAGGRIGTAKFAFLVRHKPRDWETSLHDVARDMPFSNVNVKFGVVERVDHGMPVITICNRGLKAIETVKHRHDVTVALFDDELHQRQLLEQAIRDNMESALAEQQFSVYYQPKHDVRSDRIGGAEALVRWVHPDLGLISPALFIPVFERNGFITKLDMFVWEETCRELDRCRRLGLPVVPISVNVSRLDFDVSDLPARIARIADKYGVDHSLLHVELTESAYSDNPETVETMLLELKRLGFRIELDDFGAGYSSLESLNALPLDVMKLDMSIIRKAVELDDYRIVESMVRLAQALGLATVVEGVETAGTARRVSDMGCDYIQGFYYSKPLNSADYEAYLAA